MSSEQPIAAAFGASIRYTLRTPIELTAFTTALFSTSVTSLGIDATTLGIVTFDGLTSFIRIETISSTSSEREITPSSIGCIARMPAGVLPIILYASLPTPTMS